MYCDLNVLDSIIFITQMCLHHLAWTLLSQSQLLFKLEPVVKDQAILRLLSSFIKINPQGVARLVWS